MKTLLSITTSGPYLGFALYRYDKDSRVSSKIDEILSKEYLRQSEIFFPLLIKFLKKNRLTSNQLGALAVDIGPGSFTGVRVGVSSARALAQGLNIPLIGVNSLEVLAHLAAQKKNSFPNIFVAVPALAKEWYFAAYKRHLVDGKGLVKEIVSPRWDGENVRLKTQARFKSDSLTLVSPKNEDNDPQPAAIAEVALLKMFSAKKKNKFPYSNVEPLYLQPSWAERSRAKKA